MNVAKLLGQLLKHACDLVKALRDGGCGVGGRKRRELLDAPLDDGLEEQRDETHAFQGRLEPRANALRVGSRDRLLGVHEAVQHVLGRLCAVGLAARHRFVVIVAAVLVLILVFIVVVVVVFWLFVAPLLQLLHNILERVPPFFHFLHVETSYTLVAKVDDIVARRPKQSGGGDATFALGTEAALFVGGHDLAILRDLSQELAQLGENRPASPRQLTAHEGRLWAEAARPGMGPVMSSRTIDTTALGVKGSLIMRSEIFVAWALIKVAESRARAREFKEGAVSSVVAVGTDGVFWISPRTLLRSDGGAEAPTHQNPAIWYLFVRRPAVTASGCRNFVRAEPTALVLLSAIYSFTLAAAGSLPRGVGPEFASYYQDKTEFSCITNAAIKLSLSQINDNSCDCPDGSDEPGTAACAFIDPLSPEQPLPGSVSGTSNASNALPGFWCANEGHVGTYVPFLYVNDGICDYDLCCDGSDEHRGVGGVKCENRCASIGKEYRKLQEQKRKSLESAGNKRKAMLKESAQLRKEVEDKLAALSVEVSKLEARKDELQKKHAEAERQDKGKVVSGGEGGGGKLGVLITLAKQRVSELRTALERVMDQRDEYQEKLEELEAILKKFKEEYNPNFNDEGVKAAVKAWEDYAAREAALPAEDQKLEDDIVEISKADSETSGINWKEFEEASADDTDILYNFEAYLPGFLRDLVHSKLLSMRVWLIENGVLADTNKPGSESQIVKAAREAVEAAEKDVSNKKKEVEKQQADLDKDHGPSDIFRASKNKCVSIDSGEYTYELCWLDKTMQKSKKGHGNTNMGNFAKVEWAEADEEERLDGKSLGRGRRMVLRYEDGQGCWNGPRRRTDVWLGCAEHEEVWRVSESEKCVYKMEVGTPAACEGAEGVEEPRGKDEL
ncbi:Glucosidase 2 subunit beta [Paramyrothecium foliicola]|nr:Glucosidase 2 subunit beta [Paramyrothecium foliicola]